MTPSALHSSEQLKEIIKDEMNIKKCEMEVPEQVEDAEQVPDPENTISV